MAQTEYFHSVRLLRDKCQGCVSCVKACPTEAIRVRNGKAEILPDRCIDCGLVLLLALITHLLSKLLP